MTYVFNTDLLLSDADQEKAKRAFPEVYFALDNQELRKTFKPFDQRANQAKTRSRRWGMFAVWLATGALLLAGGEMLYHDLPKTTVRLIAGIGGVAGIISVLIGVFGIMFRKRKMRWLADRLATERLRQFHFQSYVACAEQILDGAKKTEAKDAFLKARNNKLNAFQNDFLKRIDETLHELVHKEDVGHGLIWGDDTPDVNPNDPHLQEYLDAYVAFRFKRQIDYCNLILSERKKLWKHSPIMQAKVLGGVALICVFGILALHGLVFFGAVANIAWMKGPLIHVFAIWAAIIALTARTLEEGFQPEREIERMRQYRLSLKRIYERFEKSPTSKGKLAAMVDLEKLSYEEMGLFLKSNYEAEFVM